MKKFLLIASIFTCISLYSHVFGQLQPILYRLNEDGSHYLKFNFLNQIWLRYNENNPGTTIDGYTEEETFDIGLRRTRLVFSGQLTERVFVYTQFGINNFGYNSARKPGLFFHDAIGELHVIPKHLSVGAGLTGWSGLSRFASPSASTLLTLDAPLYQQATNDINDQFLRKLSAYAKGKLGKIDYRLAVTKPMSVANASASISELGPTSSFSAKPPKLQYQGYVMFQFLDQESNATPYNVGTYLGEKNVINIGAGFIYQQDAMWHSSNNGADTLHSDMALFAVDMFVDHTINKSKKSALTAYASLSSSNYGRNYLRNIGPMNPADGVNKNGTLNGPGNNLPLIGTGTTAYLQLGYLFKQNLLKKLGTLQPFIASQYSEFSALHQAMITYETGINWLIQGHSTKLSINYQSRPIYKMNSNSEWVSTIRKGMLITQLQIAI